MPNGERWAAVTTTDRASRGYEILQRTQVPGATAVAWLIERDNRQPRRSQTRYPRREAQREARPAVDEQHVRLLVGITPGIGGNGIACNHDFATAHFPVRTACVGRPRTAAGKGCGEQ